MSQGDRISQGGKGTNYPYQSKVLKGLQKSIDELEAINSNTAPVAGLATEATLSDIDTKVTSLTRTPNILRTTGAGTIAPAIYDFSVFNAGLADGVFLGATIRPGETFSYAAGALNNIYAAATIAYDATGTELIIAYNS